MKRALPLLLFFAANSAFAQTTTQAGLDGTWGVKSGKLQGGPLPASFMSSLRLTIKKDTYLVKSNEGTDEGTLKVVQSGNLKGIDIKGTHGPSAGRTILTIYKLKGNELTVCYAFAGPRPTKFESKPGTPSMLITYRRVGK